MCFTLQATLKTLPFDLFLFFDFLNQPFIWRIEYGISIALRDQVQPRHWSLQPHKRVVLEHEWDIALLGACQ